MTTITRHPAGTFCWFELATTDQAGARTFYSQLFGYEVFESPLEAGATYTMMRLGGRDACALYAMRAQDHPPGTPPHWVNYLAVDDADAAAAKVKAAGGQIMSGPFDVMQHGRMAICIDAVGAPFCIWQSKDHPGVSVMGEPGAFGWCQLNVPSAMRARAQAFYTAAFGWTYREDPIPMGDVYTTWLASGQPTGGMMPMPPGVNAPPHWLLYLATADVDATAAKAKQLGGKWMVPPMDIPGTGRFAVIQDPQGAVFAVLKFTKPM